MSYDGLWDVFTTQAMGALTEACNAELGISREEQDAFSALSHQRAAEAWKNGLFDDEVVSVEIPQRKGDPISFRDDEGIRRRHDDRVPRQAAARLQQGRHDHRRLVLADLRRCGRGRGDEQGEGRRAGPGLAGRDRRPRCRRWSRLDPAVAAVGTRSARPAHARASARPTSTSSRSTRRSPASASSPCATSAWARTRSTSTAARSLSGTRSACRAPGIALHLALELKRRGGGVGAAALCGGGGQGDALIVRVPKA